MATPKTQCECGSYYTEAGKEKHLATKKHTEFIKKADVIAEKPQKIKCDCGGQYTEGKQDKHNKTQKHQAFVNPPLTIYCICGAEFPEGTAIKHNMTVDHVNFMKEHKPTAIKEEHPKEDKINCECGSVLKKSSLSKHLSGPKHLKWAENKN